jgi:hypothetical protein
MGAHQSTLLASYEDVLKQSKSIVLISTLPRDCQVCLIAGTIMATDEEERLNRMMRNGLLGHPIVVYGRNCTDRTSYRKMEQLVKLGFDNVMVYPGGMFEWLLLQDAYGVEAFSTTALCTDIMMYGPIHN